MEAAAEASMLNPIALFLAADLVVKGIMIGLAVASLWSWAVIIDKAFRFSALNSQASAFERQLAIRQKRLHMQVESSSADFPDLNTHVDNRARRQTLVKRQRHMLAGQPSITAVF